MVFYEQVGGGQSDASGFGMVSNSQSIWKSIASPRINLQLVLSGVISKLLHRSVRSFVSTSVILKVVSTTSSRDPAAYHLFGHSHGESLVYEHISNYAKEGLATAHRMLSFAAPLQCYSEHANGGRRVRSTIQARSKDSGPNMRVA